MMKIYRYPEREIWPDLVKRPVLKREEISELIAEIFKTVERHGDKALIDFNKKFDKAVTPEILVSEAEVKNAENEISEELKKAIRQAKENISRFHAAQITQT